MVNKTAFLNPEFISYIEFCDEITIFRHPLYVTLYSNGSCTESTIANNTINEVISSRTKTIKSLEKSHNYKFILEIVERPFRFEYLLRYIHRVPDCEYWGIVNAVWSDAKSRINNDINKNLWLKIFTSNKKHNNYLDCAFFKSLPDVIPVYRCGDKTGINWTLNKERATKLSNQYGIKRQLHCGQVKKSDVLHFVSNGIDSEVVTKCSNIIFP